MVLVLAMTFAGLVLEDMGARVETLFDARRERQVGKQFDNWYAYLRTAFKADPNWQALPTHPCLAVEI
jgi:hypothetical protein